MKAYPSIPHQSDKYFGEEVILFNKYDGNNIRAECNKKGEWYKFGSRKILINDKSPILGNAINIFKEKYSEELNKIFRDKYSKVLNFVVYFEYFGENSFAGKHIDNDIMDVILFDVDQYKHGIINPFEFIKNFGHLHIPEIIYEGKYNSTIVKDINQNKFSLQEGVVVKGLYKSKNNNNKHLFMEKIKTKDWLNKLKEINGEAALLEELNNDSSLLFDAYFK